MITDDPANASRGKFVASMLLFQAAMSAVFVGWVGARMPSWFVGFGYDAPTAGRLTFWVMGTLALGGSMLAVLVLRNPPLVARNVESPPPTARTQVRHAIGNLKQIVA